MHLRKGQEFLPLQVNAEEAMEFETENFSGRALFLHRPLWSFEGPDKAEPYPYRQHFQGRKRLWEWRLQGRFKRRPEVLYCGIELEEYVAVSWGTRALMKGLLPLIQRALQCKDVHHEIGQENDMSLRPACVAPVWAVDNTLVHDNPSEAPALNSPTIPTGLSRKAARQYWETLWSGGGPSWEEQPGGPTFTFVLWGPSPLMDIQNWVFRKLPLTWGKNLSLEPFCGRQPVHAVMYELSAPDVAHRQENKTYSWDIRFLPERTWQLLAMGDKSPDHARLSAEALGVDNFATSLDDDVKSRTESFCSALSHHSGSEDDDDEDDEALQLLEAGERIPAVDDLLRSPSSALHMPIVGPPDGRSQRGGLWARLKCCKRRRRPRWQLLNS